MEVQREYSKSRKKDSKRWDIESQIKSEVFGMQEIYDSNLGKYVVPQPIEGKHLIRFNIFEIISASILLILIHID